MLTEYDLEVIEAIIRLEIQFEEASQQKRIPDVDGKRRLFKQAKEMARTGVKGAKLITILKILLEIIKELADL